MTTTRVLFACTHNSARSQMAEALLRSMGGPSVEAASAGTDPVSIRPETATVMAEIGISVAGQSSKSIGEFAGQTFDWYVTVCDGAREACPAFPGARATEHWSVDDPSSATGTDEERLAAFRRARDDLRQRVETFVAAARI